MPEPKDIRHGTPAGYHAHRQRKQPACTPCTEAVAAQDVANRILSGRNAYVRVPVELLGVLAANVGAEIREVADVMLRAVVVQACEERARRDEDLAEHVRSTPATNAAAA
ncbi:hypothetical protein AB0425_17730 [Actinosynnema sp. NPDC051121]